MKFVYILMSIAYFVQFPVCALQQTRLRNRSASEPQILVHNQPDEVESHLAQNYPELKEKYYKIKQEKKYLTTPANFTLPARAPQSNIAIKAAKIGLPLLTTAGLTAKYLYDGRIKTDARFEPLTIIAGIGAFKNVAILAVALGMLYYIKREITAPYREREKRIKLDYEQRAKNLDDKMEKFKEELNSSLKSHEKKIEKKIEDAAKGHEAFRNSVMIQLDKHKKELKVEFKEMRKEMEEAHRAVELFNKISYDISATQKQFKDCTKTVNEAVDNALRRFKKCLHLINQIPDKILKQSAREELAQEIQATQNVIIQLSDSNQRIFSATQPVPPLTPSSFDKFKALFKKNNRSSSNASDSLRISLNQYSHANINHTSSPASSQYTSSPELVLSAPAAFSPPHPTRTQEEKKNKG